MSDKYDVWMSEVRDALHSINMPLDEWQSNWPFDFGREYENGTNAGDAAVKANRYWWHSQNSALGRDCLTVPGCWLPRGHRGKCEPCYEPGDYVKAEFPDEATGIAEWMWVRVEGRDDERQVVFGRLDNEPLNDYRGRVKLGSQLAVSYTQIQEHKKASQFRK